MNKLFVSLVVVFLVIAGALVFQASRTGTSDVIMPSDLAARSAGETLNRIRVAGRVANATIDYKVEPAIELRFSIEDPGTKPDKKQGTIPVFYAGIKPDMFATGRDVIIDGDFSAGVLTANKLLTQCPSKYEPPKVQDTLKK